MVTYKLTKHCGYWESYSDWMGDPVICTGELAEWVDIPDNAKHIWVTLCTEKKSENQLKTWIKVRKRYGNWRILRKSRKYEYTDLMNRAYCLLLQMESDIVYVLFEYE